MRRWSTYGHYPSWIPQHWRTAMNFEEDKVCSSCLTVQRNWAVLVTPTYFQPFQHFCIHQQGTMLLLSLCRLYFLLLSPSSLICLCDRDFSEDRSPLINGSFYHGSNMRSGLTAAFCAQSLNKENKSCSENLFFCWEVHACQNPLV